MAVEDVEGGTRRTTSWLKQHIVEIIGAIIALVLLVFAWKARSSGTSVVAPATTTGSGSTGSGSGSGSTGSGSTTDTSQFATLSDLATAIQGATQQEQSDVAALTAQVQQTQGNLTSGLASLQSTLQGAEQADVQSLTAQLQTQAASLTNVQQQLQKQIQDAQAANQSALAANLQQQASALSQLQSNVNDQISSMRGQVSGLDQYQISAIGTISQEVTDNILANKNNPISVKPSY